LEQIGAAARSHVESAADLYYQSEANRLAMRLIQDGTLT